ncbi:MAG: GxxExxY protein [Bryobacteraceae bacterium]|nr:GxxExxY protein [Bryobacteraceae bacterium]
MLHELRLRSIQVESEVPFHVAYKGQSIGNYVADIVVERQVVVELKCAEHFAREHTAHASTT